MLIRRHRLTVYPICDLPEGCHVTRKPGSHNRLSEHGGRFEGNWYPDLATVAGVLEMLSHVDERVVFETLNVAQGIEWRQSLAAIRSAVRLGENGGEIRFLRASHAGTLHRLLGLCPEEVVPRAAPRLAFINDARFRESIARDVDSLDGLFRDGEWKAVTVIGGSVVEALLLAVLLDPANEPRATAEAARRFKEGDRRWEKTLDSLDLWQLVELARHLRIIGNNVANVCDGARDFRNLIHPGRERAAAPCDKGTAQAALAAVENLLATFGGERG